MITVDEIDARLRNGNWEIKSEIDKYTGYFYNFGVLTGIAIERHNLKTSGPGNSDWINVMLKFRDLENVFRARYNAWLISHNHKPILY